MISRLSLKNVPHKKYSTWRHSRKQGHFYPEIPDGVKPTHIIVGAGSAGSVLANRLTENPDNRVLLIEPGPRDDWWRWKIHMPSAYLFPLRDDRYNWLYHTYPQRNLNDRVIYWPRGRIWGGSSSINAMVYIRGHPNDYDRWEEEGATGWSYKNCLPYFKKAQTHELCSGNPDEFRGHEGPLFVSKGKCDHALHQAFIEAGESSGVGLTDDMNGFKQEGVGALDLTIRDGQRCSASAAFLRPILSRPNLFMTEGITCTKDYPFLVIFHRDRAIGVDILRQQQNHITPKVNSYIRERIYCEDAVILSAGAINSPHILMHSGIGPGSHLKALKIPLVQEMLGVGENLQDHIELHVQQKCSKPITLYNTFGLRYLHNMISASVQWFILKSGVAASSHLESGGFARSLSEVEHPDIQFHFYPSTVQNDGRDNPTCHAYQLHVGTLRPHSRGILRLLSNDPRKSPVCDPRYLSDDRDIVDLRKCVLLARELFAQKSFAPFRGEEIAPGPNCLSESEIDEFIRARAVSAYHQCGTCKMGNSSDYTSVVDPITMNVHGFQNLKIVDASVMPSIVSGNLNAPTIMLAERAADLIMGKNLPPEEPEIWQPAHRPNVDAHFNNEREKLQAHAG